MIQHEKYDNVKRKLQTGKRSISGNDIKTSTITHRDEDEKKREKNKSHMNTPEENVQIF